MIIGIMQPYFVPYIGYWQLINAVDKYVIYDDVNYINRGWINRNYILFHGQRKFLNVPMLGASQNKLINEIVVNNDLKLHDRNLKILHEAYKKAPYFQEVFSLMEKIILCGYENLALYIEKSICEICDYLDIGTEIIISSQLKKDSQLKGQEKILAICTLLNATEYYNPIGGQALYSTHDFAERGIKLKFLNPEPIHYMQFGDIFEPNLSIIDIMMFNSKREIKEMLKNYTLL